jgi:two-component system response regulator PrrA
MDRPRVLLVEDDQPTADALRRYLQLDRFAVLVAGTGEQALALVDGDRPDALVLDVGLPGIDGITVARTLRGRGHHVPILIHSAQGELDDRLSGLAAGADDYLVKPFASAEVSARLNALLRRLPAGAALPLVRGDVRLDPARRTASAAGRPLTLTRREFDLLETLVRHAGAVLSRGQLLDQVWGYGAEVEPNTVDLFVGYLRRKLEAGGRERLIHTVRGVGFVLRS